MLSYKPYFREFILGRYYIFHNIIIPLTDRSLTRCIKKKEYHVFICTSLIIVLYNSIFPWCIIHIKYRSSILSVVANSRFHTQISLYLCCFCIPSIYSMNILSFFYIKKIVKKIKTLVYSLIELLFCQAEID